MATIQSSTTATAQALALVKGPSSGASGASSSSVLRILDDKATLAVGAPLVDVSEGDCIRFGVIPKGAKIIPNLSRLVTTHTAAVAGKLVLRPLDGSTVTEIASVTAQLEALAVSASGNAETLSIENGSILDAINSPAATADSWVEFVPTSDLTIASSTKYMWARIVYSTLN